MPERIYRFGPYQLDLSAGCLLRDGRPVSLTPKAFDLLRLLVEHHGRLLEKGDLMRRLWPDTFVEEANLTQHVFTLRRVLGEQADGRPYIETAPRRGYRFAADVEERVATEAIGLTERPPAPRIATRRLLVPVVSVIVVGALLWSAVRMRHAAQPERNARVQALAVLPFRALAGGDGDEYLAVGMADAVITRLAAVRRLTVRSTSSVIRFARTDDPRAAGRALGVDAVLDGRFQLAHDRIRVTAQLVDVSSGTSLWAGTFDEAFKDVFAVQDDISRRVAEALVSNLPVAERDRLTVRAPPAPAAYRLYVRGRYSWERRTPDALKRSIEYYRQAIAIDPGYALAYAGLGDSYIILGNVGALSPDAAFPAAKAAAARALAIDPSISEATVAQAFATYLYDRDWGAAERGFAQALKEAPNYGPGHQWYAVCLVSRGRFDQALGEIRQAVDDDPASPIINAVVVWIEYLSRDYTDALAQSDQSTKMDPDFPVLHGYRGLVYAAQGRHAEAADELRRLVETRGTLSRDVGLLGHELALQGKTRALEDVRRLLASGEREPAALAYASALIDLGLQRNDEAVVLLGRAADAHYPWAIHYNIDPMLDPLRNRPEFKAMLARLGLPVVPLRAGH